MWTLVTLQVVVRHFWVIPEAIIMVTPISSKSRIIFAHVVLNQAYPIISGQLGSCTILNQNKFIRILLLLSQDKALFQ